MDTILDHNKNMKEFFTWYTNGETGWITIVDNNNPSVRASHKEKININVYKMDETLWMSPVWVKE